MTTLEARIAEVVAQALELDDDEGVFYTVAPCEHPALIAAALATLIREAQAEAWDKGCGAGDAYGYQRNEFGHQYIDQLDTPANPYRSAS